MAVTIRPQPAGEVEYPTSDGKPMAETDRHGEVMIYLREALKTRYRHRSDVYVSGNNFVFFQEGDPKKRVSPDCYVVFGVPPGLRDSYKAWEEDGRMPDVVFEITSKKTRREDVYTKRPLYERVLRVPEYFQFDPTGDYLRPRLQGFRLTPSGYAPLEMIEGRLRSERLELELVQDGEQLRLYDPETSEWLLSALELAERLEEQARRADAAEAELARLRAELDARSGRE